MFLVTGHKFLHLDNGFQLLLVCGHPELFHGASSNRNCIHIFLHSYSSVYKLAFLNHFSQPYYT